ncbi:MAG: hypothetical protein JNJ75_05385 [Cyclobacteriaceae bacterium]|nr:hypothetical protein [Cyclobacteriaceae bacterium]
MKVRVILIYVLAFFSPAQSVAQEHVAHWLDTTLTDGRYIKIYTTSDNDWKNLFAEWGLGKEKHKVDLGNFEQGYLVGDTDFQVSWTTKNAFVLKKSCGTDCSYVLVFDVRKSRPYWLNTDVTPDNQDDQFFIDNKALVVSFSDTTYFEVKIQDLETGKKCTFQLPEYWARGVGRFHDIVDSLTVKGDLLSIYQSGVDNLTSKRMAKKLAFR